MAVQFPNGSIVSLAATYGTTKAMSAVSNANPGVATLEGGHNVATGDIIEVTSGWSNLTNKVVKAGTVSSNDVPLSGIDTTLTTRYPALGGTGTVREVATWAQLAQILTFTGSGGEQKTKAIQFLEADAEIEYPTVKGASKLTIGIADDISLAGYLRAVAVDEDKSLCAIRVALPNGGMLYYNGTISATRTPTMSVNNELMQTITVFLSHEPVRY